MGDERRFTWTTSAASIASGSVAAKVTELLSNLIRRFDGAYARLPIHASSCSGPV
jgi:hypothetical protein